jgi:hypothetical protein
MTLQPNFSTHISSSCGSANDTFVREGITPLVLFELAACCFMPWGGASVTSMFHVNDQASRHADLSSAASTGRVRVAWYPPRATLPVLVGRGTGIFSEFPQRRYPSINTKTGAVLESFATVCRTTERRFANRRPGPPRHKKGSLAFDHVC